MVVVERLSTSGSERGVRGAEKGKIIKANNGKRQMEKFRENERFSERGACHY